MKKLFAGILSAVMMFTLSGCDNATNSSDSSQSGATSSNNSESKPSSTASSPTETSTDSTPSETPSEGGKTLVAVYSASGNTKAIAEYIATATGADLFEITPTEPYTSDDLDWTNRNSRVSREHDDESLRDVELVTTTVNNWEDYDSVTHLKIQRRIRIITALLITKRRSRKNSRSLFFVLTRLP